MAKPKFTLNPSPTFKATVLIPVPGGTAAGIEFTFKHRPREDFKTFMEGMEDRDDIDLLMDVVSGWDLDDAFDADNLAKMTKNYMGSGHAIVEKYISEMTKVRAKN
jgi:hypothetical protein